MRKPILAFLFVWIASGAAVAEDAKTALKEFGLIGTWSSDCAKDVSKEFGTRVTYTAPFFGVPMQNVISNSKELHLSAKNEILNAVRVTEEKIEIQTTTREMTRDGQAGPGSTIVIESIIEKVGPKIRVLESHSTDGTVKTVVGGFYVSGIPVPAVERCLNQRELNQMYSLLLNPVANDAQYQINERVNRVVMFLRPEEQLCQQLLTSVARKLYDAELNVPGRHTQPRA